MNDRLSESAVDSYCLGNFCRSTGALRWFCLVLLLFCGLAASAQTVSPQQLADLQKQVTEARSNADNAWMLVSSALVLMMTGPGLALFYGGLVRRKNVLSTMMQSFAMMAVVTVIWGVVGFSLAFGPGNGFIGDFSTCFCTAWARRRIPTMPRPFRCRPSWSIS